MRTRDAIDNSKWREKKKQKNRRLISIYYEWKLFVIFRVVHWNAFIRERGERLCRESVSFDESPAFRFILNDVKLMYCWHETYHFVRDRDRTEQISVTMFFFFHSLLSISASFRRPLSFELLIYGFDEALHACIA